MAVTKSHAVFLGFCNEALDRIRDDKSTEAGDLRSEIEVLVKRLESWTTTTTTPKDKDATISAVLELYRRAQELATRRRG
jgi:hypothetical protein